MPALCVFIHVEPPLAEHAIQLGGDSACAEFDRLPAEWHGSTGGACLRWSESKWPARAHGKSWMETHRVAGVSSG